MKINWVSLKFLNLAFLFIVANSCSSNRIVFKGAHKNNFLIVNTTRNVYCNKYEVTNSEYNEFLKYLKINDFDEYTKCNIDTTKWYDLGEGLEPIAKNYAWHPAFKNYPVVNVQHYGAKKFCDWVTEKHGRPEVKFRLPSEKEFYELLEKVEVELHSDSADDYNCPNFNLRYIGDSAKDGGLVTVPAKDKNTKGILHFQQSEEGVLHVIGNVAEFLDDGRAIGGGWNSFPSETRIANEIKDSNANTGFRIWKVVKKAGS